VNVIPNVLANRYASAELAHLFSPEHKIVLERRLWLAVLRAQYELGPGRVLCGLLKRIARRVPCENITA